MPNKPTRTIKSFIPLIIASVFFFVACAGFIEYSRSSELGKTLEYMYTALKICAAFLAFVVALIRLPEV